MGSMHFRELGNTGLKVSVIGLGCGYLGSQIKEVNYAIKLVHRALKLGINYFDTAREYRDSEVRLGLGLKGNREKVYVSSKTIGKTKDEAWQHLRDSLERLQTDYLDNYHLHALENEEDIEKRLGSGGALEALIEARDEGLIRHIGCTSHSSHVLVKALKHFNFEVILVPMNIVEHEPLKELIPLCKKKGVGVTIMKPVASGALPGQLALKWLLKHPISTVVPGVTTLEQLVEDANVGHLDDMTITTEEKEQIKKIYSEISPKGFWWHSSS